jgi:hypothetical protein
MIRDRQFLVMSKVLLMCFGLFALVLAGHAQSLTFSTYLGLADCDGIAVGSNGDLYLACHSPSSFLPIDVKPPKQSGTNQTSDPDPFFDAYVLRVTPQSGKLIYATRIGGSDYDGAFRIKVDAGGFAYAIGMTKSPDFPVTTDAVQKKYGGGESDAFLVKVAPDGRIVYSTYLGGSGADESDALELDGENGVFVGGTTDSSDFPGQSRHRTTSKQDAFVALIKPGDPYPLKSVVFGGKDEEMLTGLARDGRGGLFAVGYTKSSDFPTLKPIQAKFGGVSDMFLLRFALPNLSLTFSTFFGGSGEDQGWGVTVDRRGNPIVSGFTGSTDLPFTSKAYQSKNRGDWDAFLATFSGGGYRDVRSTYFGGANKDVSGGDGDDIKMDAHGNIWLVGWTTSLDLPTLRALQSNYGGGEQDGFIVAFSPDLEKVCYSTYRGGSGQDSLEGIAISTTGFVYATGETMSQDLQMPVKTIQGQLSPVNLGGQIVNATVLGLSPQDPCRETRTHIRSPQSR